MSTRTIESPGPLNMFDGDIKEYNKALNAYRLVQTGAIPELAGLIILEVPAELQSLPIRTGE